jgi:hypothetical protein
LTYSPLLISTAAATVVPFENAKPIVTKWVSPTGSNSGSGSSSSPYKTIQYAVDKAAPGTAIMVKAGTYAENIKVSKSGTTDKPIWLVSADGEGSATIKAANTSLPVVYGYGVDNLVVKGFKLAGGTEGIKFTQSGNHLTNMVTHLVVEENQIYGQKIDGIKTAQTVGAAITGNTVHNISSQEGIDNVYMRNGIIANNEVYDVRGLSGIVVKAGSQNVKIINNNVYKTPDGILIGGHSDKPGYIFPKELNYQAKGITVQDNKVSATKNAVYSMGGIDGVIKENSLTGANWNVAVNKDNLGYASKSIQILNNDVSKGSWLWAAGGSVTANKGNGTSTWFDSSQLGPDKLKMHGIAGAVAGASGSAAEMSGAIHPEAVGAMGGSAGSDSVPVSAGTDWHEAGPRKQPYSLAENIENLIVHTETVSPVADDVPDSIDTAAPEAEIIFGTGGHDLIQTFNLGQDRFALDLSEVAVARTGDDDQLQHEGASLALVGVHHDAALAEVLA